MQLEVILPLVAYLVVVFGISVYAMRKRSTGTFLNEYFLGSRSMGGIVLAMTLTATYISASSFIGGPELLINTARLGIAGDDPASCSLAFCSVFPARSSRFRAPLQCSDAERYAVCPLPESSLVWLASLSLLVAFVGAMTVQFIGGARLLETAAGIPL